MKKVFAKSYRQLSEDLTSPVYESAQEKAVQALAHLHGVMQKNVVTGSGAGELLHTVLHTLKPRRALIPVPSIPLYFAACRLSGCEAVPYTTGKASDFDIDVTDLIAKAPGFDMIILSNPGNPTGRMIGRQCLQKLLDYCQEKGVYLVIDESYADFVAADISAVKHVNLYANIVILRTLANYFALSGLRFGYVIACESLTGLIRANQVPGTVGYFPLLAYSTLLRDKKYIKKTKAWLASEPKRFFHILSTLGGVTAFKPVANYIFVELEQIPAATLCDRLAAKGISVRSCNKTFGTEGQYIRIAIKDRRSNDRFLDAFSRCLL